MTWTRPEMLLALWLLPVVGGLLYHAHRRRIAAAHALVDPEMTRRLMPNLIGARPWIKGALLLAALAMLITAAAGPRFGVRYETVAQKGVDLFVCVDVSKSMLAEDVRPSRLERAKSDVRDLLPELEGDRVGLIAFAGKPVVKVPLTDDQDYLKMVLDELDPTSAPRGGSLIGDAVRKAMEAMPPDATRDQAIVLITDGEDQESLPREAAALAASRGVKIFTIGLGDAVEGARIPIRDDQGQLHYMQDAGQEVWSKVDEALLRDMAVATSGAYIPAGTKAYDLGRVYSEHLSELARGERIAEKRMRYRQQYQMFLCLGVVLLMTDLALPRYSRRKNDRGVFNAVTK